MATIAEMIKSSFARRRERRLEEEHKANPLDKDLPLGLCIDCKIEIHPSLPQGMNMKPLGRTHLVQAFSRAVVSGKTSFKVLLHSEEGEEISYLWIQEDAKGLAVRWFVTLDEVFPENDEEWDFWFADKDGSIGLPEFQTKDGISYQRLWQPGSAWRIEPVSYTETMFPDRYDSSKRFDVAHDCMLYGRNVGNDASARDELIMLSGVKEPEGNHIAIDIGIDLDPTTDLSVHS
jgi:hypothetical protein